MNGYEHFQRAEELLAAATRTRLNNVGLEICMVPSEEKAELSGLAAVHATLALAAATADATSFKRELARANGVELERRTVDPAAFAAAYLD
ncbi:hypothetical protein ACFYWN_20290 [Streptomyces sp. NPDC002917]|uniref:hypothetical protein n=1 Tax=Streptomyces sp. NPDC002917 TaxID=3364671 RepID=UPI003696997F